VHPAIERCLLAQPTSDAAHATYRFPLGAQLFRYSPELDFTFGQDNMSGQDSMPFGKINQIVDVLVDENDCDSFPPGHAQRRPDMTAHLRCEAFGRLVNQHDVRIAEKRAPDR
jgi:hypothetical protein